MKVIVLMVEIIRASDQKTISKSVDSSKKLLGIVTLIGDLRHVFSLPHPFFTKRF